MEWCLQIRDEMDLEGDLCLHPEGNVEASQRLQSTILAACCALLDGFGKISFDHIYFGAEFCEQLIPSVDELQGVLRTAAARDVRFTLVTPYVSNVGLNKLRPLFEALHQDGNHEVVFSDWGVLNLLRREFPRLVPIQGRLLNKSLRDPRIASAFTQLQPTSTGPAPALIAVQRSNLDSPTYLDFLSQLEVRMVEIDNAPQGTDFSFANKGIAVSVPYPFGIVTTGRTCMAAGLGYPKAQKFQPGAACHRECQTFSAEFQGELPENEGTELYLQGNSYFYVQTEAMFRRLVLAIQSGAVARVVYQPRMPMLGSRTTSVRRQAQIPVFC
jgi:hypothetical protein